MERHMMQAHRMEACCVNQGNNGLRMLTLVVTLEVALPVK